MDRLTRFQTVYAFLPFLHLPDLTFLRHVSRTWKCIAAEWTPRLTFYGLDINSNGHHQHHQHDDTDYHLQSSLLPSPYHSILLTVPIPVRIPMAHVLFVRDYSLLQELLDRNIDRRYEYPYAYVNEHGLWVNSTYRMEIYQHLWNRMTLLELAYLLKDKRAIDMFQHRTIAHTIKGYCDQVATYALDLARDYSEHEVVDELTSLLGKENRHLTEH